MLHKLKPVPRALIILAIVGAGGYGVSESGLMTKLTPSPQVEAAVDAPTKAPSAMETADTEWTKRQERLRQEAAATAQAAIKEAGLEEPSGLTPSTSNAGLDAVLNAGKKN